jgi:hypothetical protein
MRLARKERRPEKEIKYDESTAGNYMRKCMTGMEAYRAMLLCLERWHELIKKEKECPPEQWMKASDYLEFIVQRMDNDQGMWQDWELAVKEMLEEREEYGDELLAYRASGIVYKPCPCELCVNK